MSDVIEFESHRVGRIEVRAADVLTFDPLPGFPNKTRYVVMEHAADSPLAWLVSLEDPDVAFVVASPWTFFPQYDPPVEREHLGMLGIEHRDDVELLCIVTLSDKEIFLNLAAPLLINAVSRKGTQVVSDDPRYTTRAPLPDLRAEGQEGEAEGAEPTTTSPSAPPAR